MKIEQIAYLKGYRVTMSGVLLNPKNIEIGSLTGRYLYGSFKSKKNNVKLKRFSAHRLQAFQKYGNKLYEEGIMVRHKNGNPIDNSWDNILIGTNKENAMDIPEHIRISRALHASSFLRKHDKEEVKKYYQECKSYKKTMEKFNISSKGTLHYILNN